MTDVPNDKKYDIEYDGWGPCCHKLEDRGKIFEWVNGIVSNDSSDPEGYWGGMVADLAFDLNLMGASVTLLADQWTAVDAAGSIHDGELTKSVSVHTYIQGDTFLISMVETYRFWKEKYKELTGEEWE